MGGGEGSNGSRDCKAMRRDQAVIIVLCRSAVFLRSIQVMGDECACCGTAACRICRDQNS